MCHAQSIPIVLPDLPKRIYQELEQEDEHLLRLMTPIQNEARCSSAACHYHPAEEKVLGVLDVSFSLREKDRLVLDIKRNTIILAFSLFVATFITIFVVFYFLIKEPIGKIMNDANTLAQGEPLPNSSAPLTDEIGSLSAAVHKMGHDLIDKQTQLILQKNLYQNLFEGVPCLITVQDRTSGCCASTALCRPLQCSARRTSLQGLQEPRVALSGLSGARYTRRRRSHVTEEPVSTRTAPKPIGS